MKIARFLMQSMVIELSLCRKCFNENFCENVRNFRFRSQFRWLNEIFGKEIKRKFGNPNFIGQMKAQRGCALNCFFKNQGRDSHILPFKIIIKFKPIDPLNVYK